MLTCGSPVYATGSGITAFAVVASASQASSSTDPFVFDQGFKGGAGFGMIFSTSYIDGYTPTNYGGAGVNVAETFDSGSHLLQMSVTFGDVQDFCVDKEIILSSSITLATLDATTVDWSATRVGDDGEGGPFTVGSQSKSYNQEERFGSFLLAELIVYDTALSSEEITAINIYLNERYRLGLYHCPRLRLRQRPR